MYHRGDFVWVWKRRKDTVIKLKFDGMTDKGNSLEILENTQSCQFCLAGEGDGFRQWSRRTLTEAVISQKD